MSTRLNAANCGPGTATARSTVRSAAGEQAILKATDDGVVRVCGSYWPLRNLVLDNNGLMDAAVSVVGSGSHSELLNSEVRYGTSHGTIPFR